MKNLFIIIVIVLSFNGLKSQNFGEIGAEWYFGYENPISFVNKISFEKFTVVKDSIFKSKPCKLINDNIFIYNSNDTVYFYDSVFDEFQILYVFNSSVNDYWQIKVKDETGDIDTVVVTVDSLSTMQVNNIDLHVMNVTYSKIAEHQEANHYSKIVERIGDMKQFFNWKSETDDFADDTGYYTGIRCYEDATIGHYQKDNSIACDYVFIGIDELKNNKDFLIYPNPTSNKLHIKYEKTPNIFYKIIDYNGKILTSNKLTNKNIDIKNLAKGIYTLVLYNSQEELKINNFVVF